MSDLQRQLKKIQGAYSAATRKASTLSSASLLFSEREASDLDADSLFEIGISGLNDLKSQDQSFSPFSATLFDPSVKHLHRSQQTVEANLQIDASVTALLRILSPYFLSRPAQQVVEFLIRRYEIHVRNVDALISCAIPFHDAPIFGTLVGLVAIEGTKWAFLESCKKNKSPCAREAIVNRCLSDYSVFNSILSVAKPSERPVPTSACAFVTAVSIEVLRKPTVVFSSLIRELVPFLSTGLEQSDDGELQIACMAVVCELCSRTTLIGRFVALIMEALSKHAKESRLDRIIMTLFVVAETQRVAALPKRVVHALLSYSSLPLVINDLCGRYDGRRFCIALMRTVLHQFSKTNDAGRLDRIFEVLAELDVLREPDMQHFIEEELSMASRSLTEKDDEEEEKVKEDDGDVDMDDAEAAEEGENKEALKKRRRRRRRHQHAKAVVEASETEATLQQRAIPVSFVTRVRACLMSNATPSAFLQQNGHEDVVMDVKGGITDAEERVDLQEPQERLFENDVFTSLLASAVNSSRPPLSRLRCMAVLRSAIQTLPPDVDAQSLLVFFVYLASVPLLRKHALPLLKDLRSQVARVISVSNRRTLVSPRTSIHAPCSDVAAIIDEISAYPEDPTRALFTKSSMAVRKMCMSVASQVIDLHLRSTMLEYVARLKVDGSFSVLKPFLSGALSRLSMVSVEKATHAVSNEDDDVVDAEDVDDDDVFGTMFADKQSASVSSKVKHDVEIEETPHDRDNILTEDELNAFRLIPRLVTELSSLADASFMVDFLAFSSSICSNPLKPEADSPIALVPLMWKYTALQQRVLSSILEASMRGVSVSNAVACMKGLSSKVVVKMLTDLLAGLQPTANAAIPHPPKSRKQSQQPASTVIAAPKDAHLRSRLTALLEFGSLMVENGILDDAYALTSPVHTVLHSSELCDDYMSKVALDLLSTLLQDTTGPVEEALEQTCLTLLRSTKNSSVRASAMRLLAVVAPRRPSKVLAQFVAVVAVFGTESTTDGTVRDDAFTFSAFEDTVRTVVPLMTENREGIVTAFVGALNNVPAHRRLSLFGALWDALEGPSKGTYMLLVRLLPIQLDLSRELVNRLPAIRQVKVLTDLMSGITVDISDGSSNAEAELNRHIASVEFARRILQGDEFRDALVDHHKQKATKMSDGEVVTDAMLQESYLSLVEALLSIMRVDGLARSASETLDVLMVYLSIPAFIALVSDLFESDDTWLRQKALLLLSDRIERASTAFTSQEAELFVELLSPIAKLIGQQKVVQDAKTEQVALLAIDVLVRKFGSMEEHHDAFMAPVAAIMSRINSPHAIVRGAALVCMASVCAGLGTKLLQFVPKVFPQVVQAIQSNAHGDAEGEATLVSCGLHACYTLVAKLGSFISPYLASLLGTLSDLLVSTSSTVTDHSVSVVSASSVKDKAAALLALLSETVAPRLALPATIEAKPSLPLFNFMAKVAERTDKELAANKAKDILRFVLSSCRSHLLEVPLQQAAFDAFLTLSLKLNEKLFRPLFSRVTEWSQDDDRKAVFFRFVSQFLARFKAVGVPFIAQSSVQQLAVEALKAHDAATIQAVLLGLRAYFTHDADKSVKNLSSLPQLLDALFQAMGTIAELDSSDSASSSGSDDESDADVDMEELSESEESQDEDAAMDDSDNEAASDKSSDDDADSEDGKTSVSAAILEDFISTILALAQDLDSEEGWKPLHYAILQRSRSDSVFVRLGSIRLLDALFENIGERYVAMLPETVPYLAELMEDDDLDVAATVRALIRKIEKISGEDLQQYLA